MKKLQTPASIAGITAALEFLGDALKAYKFGRRTVQEALLLTEESLVRLLDYSPENGEIHIALRRESGLARITLSCPGTEMPPVESVGFDLSDESMDRGTENAIRSMLLHAYEDKLRYSRKGPYNFVRIDAGMPEKASAIRTGWAFLLAVAVGLALWLLVPEQGIRMLCRYLLTPIDSIFINGLKLIAGPAVFFTIMTAVAQYSGVSDPGRVSVKVLTGYAVTSVCAVAIGMLIFHFLTPGTESSLSHLAGQIPSARTTAESLVDYIVSIVPSNIVDPFLNVNTLQIIFLALLCGMAMGRIGDYTSSVRTAADALQTLFAKAAELLSGLMPGIVFFTTLSLLLNIGVDVLRSLLGLFLTLLCGMAAVLVFYLLLILVIGRINPLVFLKKYAPHLGECFILGSAVTALPKTMRLSEKKLGISSAVTGFSLPFGALANMDGSCLYLAISGLFLARLTGVDVSGKELVSMAVTIFVLSVGAPIARGTVLLGITVLLGQLGVSVSAITVLLGLNAVFEMLQTVINVMGDVVISLVVASSEGLLDKDVFYSDIKKAARE